MGSHRGQATVEYVAALALLVCVFAGAAVAVAAPDLPRAVVAKLKTALCVVGGDVCTSEEAAARGLEPCVVAGEEHVSSNGVSVLFIRTGGTDTWAVERSSDGTVRLSQSYGQDANASVGLGFSFGRVAVGGSATGGLTFAKGRSWSLTEPRLRQVLARTRNDPRRFALVLPLLLGRPDAEYLEGGGRGSAELAAEAVKRLPAGGAEGRAVLGRRTDERGTTYYLDLGAAPTGSIAKALGADVSGRLIAEYRDAGPPALTLRARGRSGDDETETVLRLPLRSEADRAAGRRVAFLRHPGLALNDLVNRIRARGTIERLRYRTREDSRGWAYGAKLGFQLGIDHASSVLRRQLVDATVQDGPSTVRREDCLSGVRRS